MKKRIVFYAIIGIIAGYIAFGFGWHFEQLSTTPAAHVTCDLPKLNQGEQ